MKKTRTERDSMGELEVDINALYGAQTQRAINNFPVSGLKLPECFIRALLLIKSAAANANMTLAGLSKEKGEAINLAIDKLLADANLMDHFPVDIYQTGSGTSTNMNANEVIANVASGICGEKIHANDHVNFGQSSNDVIPTAIHVSASIELNNKLIPALKLLSNTIHIKAKELNAYTKNGRTHLMDAMPIRFSQSLNSWATQIEQNIKHLQFLQPSIQRLAQGGTAVGSGINADPAFAKVFSSALSDVTGITFQPSHDFFAAIGTQDTAVALSGQLKTTAVSIIKIANDLRWMNSGPLAGLGEINLEALQPGSSIMPGKVNPVIPESACMVSAQVIGHDAAITIAGQSGNFELNVMLPLIAHNLLSSIELLSNVSELLANKAIKTFTVNTQKINETLVRNPILVTALNSIIGYEKAAMIAKIAYQEGRPIIDVAEQHTDIKRDKLETLLNPIKLTEGGIPH